MSNAPKGTPLAEPEQALLKQFVNERGEALAASLLGLDRRTLARGAAGFGVHAGTRALLLQKLAGLTREAFP